MADENLIPPLDEAPAGLVLYLDYQVLRLIGRGGYGEVWLVRDKSGQHLACKVIYRARFEDSRPYEREYEGIQKFEPVSRANESQVKILHVGRRDEAGYFYYIMELADDIATGQKVLPHQYIPRTLGHELKRRGRMPAGECIRLGLSLSAALENLHEHGLIHRDIKPANIIFVNGIPKLADIGLVCSRDMTVSFVGTEGYIPAEGPGSASADVYALGKVLYEMATGRDRLDFPQLPDDLGVERERISLLELNAVLVRACANNLRERYQTAGQLHADLTLLNNGKSILAKRRSQRRWRRLWQTALTAGTVGLMAFGWLHFQEWRSRRVESMSESDAIAGSGSYSRTVETSADYARVCIRTGFAAFGLNDYPKAEKLASAARMAAQNSRNPHLIQEAEFLETEVVRCEKAYQAVISLAGKLKDDPNDPAANLAMGKFLCIMKNDWETGLPMLVRGDDPALREAAQKELDQKEETSVGDSWWIAAEKLTGEDQAGFQQRARNFYLRAIAKAKEPQKSELKQTFEDRLAQAAAPAGEIHIVSRVGNAQHIDIYPDEIRWKSDGMSRSDRINQVIVGDLKGRITSHVKNSGATRVYPEGADFSTARLIIDRKAKKRGNAKLEILPDHVRVNLTDRPNGSSELEITVTFGLP